MPHSITLKHMHGDKAHRQKVKKKKKCPLQSGIITLWHQRHGQGANFDAQGDLQSKSC